MAKLTDIAKAAGVSAGTVSHVLNGRGNEMRISPKTQERIREIANSMNYQPNAAAKRLRDNANLPIFALLFKPRVSTSLIGNLVHGVQRVQMQSEKKFEFAVYPYRSSRLEDMQSILYSSGINGFILSHTMESDSEFLNSLDRNIPIVLINRPSARYNSVYVDSYAVGEKAATLFANKGHRDVGMVVSEYDSDGFVRRNSGFLDVCKALGLSAQVWDAGDALDGLNAGYQTTAAIFSGKGTRPTALFYSYDEMALGGLRACAELGVSVPGDVEILTYGNSPYVEYSTPSLSACYFPALEMAEACMNMMLDYHFLKEHPMKTIVYETPFHFRDSFHP